MFLIRCPDTCQSERQHVVSWVFNEIFGFECRISFEEISHWELEFSDSSHCLVLDDTFFSEVSGCWLETSGLDRSNVQSADVDEIGGSTSPDQALHLPILWGKRIRDGIWIDLKSDRTRLGVDILGSLFYLISRYEEAVLPERDQHGRFPASASLMYQHSLLERAIGNDYIEMLWRAIARLWPGLKRKPREFRVLPSHDVDLPSMYWQMNRAAVAKRALRWLAKGKCRLAKNVLQSYEAYRRGAWSSDLFDSLNWIMDQSEKIGVKSAFYYIPEKTHKTYDPGMPIDHPHVEDQWRRIAERGHEIGVHPGYNSVDSPTQIPKAAMLIRKQLSKLDIQQEGVGGRHHFLRWKSSDTARAWDEAALDYDSTLGFADRAGFRCGVCYEYPLYDLKQRRVLTVRERPLIVMDCSVIDARYMALGHTEKAFDLMANLKAECKKFQGDFTVLWHNNRFMHDQEKEIYSSLLSA